MVEAAVEDPGAPQATASASRWRTLLRWGIHLLLLAAGASLLWLAVRHADLAAVREDLAKIHPAAIGLAFLAYLAAWALRVWRLHFLAAAAATRLTLPQAAATALGANALNIIAPARLGDVSAFVHLRERTGKGPESAAAILTWRLTDLGALLTVALLAGLPVLAFVPLAAGTQLLWTMAAGGGFLALAAVGVWVARDQRSRALLERLGRRLLGARAPTGAAFGRATALLWGGRVFSMGLVMAIGAWLADAVFAGLILHALWPGDPLVVLVPMVLANAAKTLPTTPGAIGVYEVVFALALQQYGVDAATALTAGIATHFLLNAWTLLLGLPGAIAIGRSVSRSATR
ncbi:MAG TPA: lysylphosphatidylglycerol synthase transmembrane domain-containing protein [Candidatus Thermoplasmatota archaeon]|nr:lysylphosphatidylglycerol synthase transmembrane domain-containing protein [Candidatus Thermoplasmatota archaeon]